MYKYLVKLYLLHAYAGDILIYVRRLTAGEMDIVFTKFETGKIAKWTKE